MLSHEPDPQPHVQQQYLLPASIQVRNVFTASIAAERHLFEAVGNFTAMTQLSLDEIQIHPEQLQAQVALKLQVGFQEEIKPFEISFKVIGIFAYNQAMAPDEVTQFLSQGSLNILLPFARELLINICTRLQIPAIMLQMIQIIPSAPGEEEIARDA